MSTLGGGDAATARAGGGAGGAGGGAAANPGEVTLASLGYGPSGLRPVAEISREVKNARKHGAAANGDSSDDETVGSPRRPLARGGAVTRACGGGSLQE